MDSAPPVLVQKEPVVRIAGLNHYFGSRDNRVQALFNINLELTPGEVVILTGPTGCGKTTFLTLTGGLRSVQEGEIHTLGQPLHRLPPRELVKVRLGIGFIFQFHNLLESLSALENVQMSMEMRDYTPEQRRDLATELLTELRMGHRLHYKPDTLSGGQNQRVAIARALVNKPKLVLADEPTASLDKEAGRIVVDMFHSLAKENGSAVILVTHDNRILDIADRIVDMLDGRIVSTVVGGGATGLAVSDTIKVGDLLRKCSLFAKLSPAEMTALIGKVKKEQYAAGATIVRQGDPGDKLRIIKSGSVELLTDDGSGPRPLAEVEEGGSFGEAMLQSEAPWTVTARAKDEVEVYALSRADYRPSA